MLYTDIQIHNIFDIYPAENRRSAAEALYTHMN